LAGNDDVISGPFYHGTKAAAMNGAYTPFFTKDPPARATVAVTALPRPAARVEIRCSAQVRRR